MFAPKTRLKKLGAGLAGLTVAGSMSIAMVGGFEGLRTYAYRDIVGVWTACYGETKGIKPGMRFSKEECNNMLLDSLIEHEQGMRKCLRSPDTLPNEVYVPALSLTYNVGVGAFCKSTVARKLNAGEIRAACDAFMMWNKAGGREVKGLTTRRAQERAMCLKAA